MQNATLDITVEQQRQNFTGGIPVLGEQVLGLTLGSICTLATSEQWCIPAQMTKQVERIGIGLFTAGSQFFEADAAFGQLTQHLGAGVRIGPCRLQRLSSRVQGAYSAT